MSTHGKYESFVVFSFSSLNLRKSNLAEDRNIDRFWDPLCSYHPCLWCSQGGFQNFQFRQEGAFCLMESINVRQVFSKLRNLKEDWDAVRAIPHICHGRHGHVRVNFFLGRCKFLQI